ncbi:MAG TPA: flagellar filament capping protein FliD, partial [Rhodocyclaceae bacterium]|nr:flagellar filament capping protein FliD [Rhodocyclaceae bacterium]
LSEMQEHGKNLGQLGTASDNASIKAQLAQFANEYNEWTRRFDEDMQSGGLLADTQAAQVARYELKQSIENIFFGVAAGGVRGMGELGLRIDPVSKLASLDTAQLDAQLASNKQGVVATVHEFGVNFAKSAELLNSEGNFIPNRLNNLDRVIDYIDANKAALQAEFGLGDSARPSGLVARALAAYQQDYAG